MTNRDDREQLRNFLIVVFAIIIIYFVTFSVAMNHQYTRLQSEAVIDQYERKVDIYNDISSDLDQTIVCQKELRIKDINNAVVEILTSECNNNLSELDNNLKRLTEMFDVDDGTQQKILLVLNRKNPQVLDQQSVTLLEQILQNLENHLNNEEKQLDVSRSINY